MDVGGAPRVLVVTPRIGAGLDGDESIAPFAVGQAPAGAGEVRIERRCVRVHRIHVTPRGVGLPHLDECGTHRAPVAVEHPPADDDPLPQRLAGVLAGQIRVLGAQRHAAEHRAWQAVEPLGRKPDELVSGCSQDRREVFRIQVGRFALEPLHQLGVSTGLGRGAWSQYPTGNRRRSKRSLTRPHTPRGSHIAMTTAIEPTMIRYHAPLSDSHCCSRKKITVPMMGPSIEPTPPIRATKIMYADHWTLKMEVAWTFSWLMMRSEPAAPAPAAATR